MEAVLATLLNDLDAMTNDIVLVLDDFHLIDRREVRRRWPSCWSTCPPSSTW